MRTESVALRRVRSLCLALPDTQERQSHGEASWFVGGKRQFVLYADHHHDDREAFWAAAPEGVQARLVEDEPARCFRPPYVGGRGWVGVWVDVGDVDWALVEAIVHDAWLTVAPPSLHGATDASGSDLRAGNGETS